jgi:hypothetical protein
VSKEGRLGPAGAERPCLIGTRVVAIDVVALDAARRRSKSLSDFESLTRCRWAEAAACLSDVDDWCWTESTVVC